jgi:hypothetical protein
VRYALLRINVGNVGQRDDSIMDLLINEEIKGHFEKLQLMCLDTTSRKLLGIPQEIFYRYRGWKSSHSMEQTNFRGVI